MKFQNDLDFIMNNPQRIKLEDILDSIKLIKLDANMIQELRVAIKILKRYKQTESSKWYLNQLLNILN